MSHDGITDAVSVFVSEPGSSQNPAVAWTPGPWFAEKSSADFWYIQRESPFEQIASTWSGLDNQEANAALIVAAPDLYAALSDLLVGYETQCRRLGVGEHAISAGMQAARAALRKARGEG